MFGDVEKVHVHVYNCDVGGVTSVTLVCDVTSLFNRTLLSLPHSILVIMVYCL